MLIFFDLEVTLDKKIIKQIGAVSESDKRLSTNKEREFRTFVRRNRGTYFVGHNIVKHDINFFRDEKVKTLFKEDNIIDTLLLSTLLFSEKPYHSLIKDDKLKTEQLNNPVNDSINSRILFFDLVDEFNKTSENLKAIYFLLLKDIPGFKGFFKYLNYKANGNPVELIKKTFEGKICNNSDINGFISSYKVELAYTLSLINTKKEDSLFPAWVLKNYSKVEDILKKLRSTPCDNCNYCHENLNSVKALEKHFGYPSFREFEGRSLQKEAVEGALKDESLIAVFPTGGGKSLTFQLPAIMNRFTTRGLTVVISPLQSLMKDQVDTLEEKNINVSVAISGLLDPIQRKYAIDRVRDGSANILYLAPESLRSITIEKLLLSRQISRFVIDEAHCFSTWGHDFRVDYLYIADFIKKIQDIKALDYKIPVSCFTATAKVDVINDIKNYFKTNLDLDLIEYTTASTRENLSYSVTKVETENERYEKLRNLLSEKDVPTIIYCSRIKTVEELTKKLNRDNFKSTMFHGRLDKDDKVSEQERFMTGEINIMVATSAFGMGIDKDNVERVIHYEISDSLENYVQEAGRAGRDQKIRANCYIFYNEDDLNKHFELLNNTKLNQTEINQMWRGIKSLTRDKEELSKSALELATTAGWMDEGRNVETKVKTAIATLEDVGYIKRKNNSPRIYADSLLSKSVIEAKDKMVKSNIFNDEEMKLATRIIISLIGSKHRIRNEGEIPETRIDYLSEILGVEKGPVINIINKFREIGILAKDKDLFAHIQRGTTTIAPNRTLALFKATGEYILENLNLDEYKTINLKRLRVDLTNVDVKTDIRTIKQNLNYLELSKLIIIDKLGADDLKVKLTMRLETIKQILDKRITLGYEIINYLYEKAKYSEDVKKDNILPFSLISLKDDLNSSSGFISENYSVEDVEDSIYLLIKIGALKIEGGFLVIYNPLNIKRIETNALKQYTKEDYGKLENFYETKKEQIHIVGEYANKMIEAENEADIFVKDYFTMDYQDFLDKYFVGKRRQDIKHNMTPNKFKELFGDLSKQQRDVILDKTNKRIGVFAGPGSGKTRLLVHKLASILHTEDTKTEELLMLTFSRQAALEFKSRLFDLMGTTAYHVNITTFHSFAFDVIETLGDEEKFDDVIIEAAEAIKNISADVFKITKSVLVVDEAQDMTYSEFELVKALIDFNPGIRVIAVGDDDQNIFEWRKASSEYLKEISDEGKRYELSINFRSKRNLVEFSNLISRRIKNRYKRSRIVSNFKEDGLIEAYKYESDNIISPLVDKVISNNRSGTTCIITRTNEDAILITGLLNKKGVQTSLIQESDNFRLYNMLEFRYFYDLIAEETEYVVTKDTLGKAFGLLKQKFSKSKNYKFVQKTINDLLKNYNEIYLSDLNELFFETFSSDIYDDSKIVVSTFHKAKGKEFDNVYILLNEDKITNDGDRRVFYVGVTRAKSFLSIHSKMDYSNLGLNNFKYYEDNNNYEEPEHIELLITHRDLYLNLSARNQENVYKLMPGDNLGLTDKYYLIGRKNIVGRLSKKAIDNIEFLKEKGYSVQTTTLNNLVYWYDKNETEQEYLLPFAKITLNKNNDVNEN